MTTTRIALLGDINLLGVADPAVPFSKVAAALKATDAVFANLECCLFNPAEKREMMRDDQSGFEGIYAPPAAGESLRRAGIDVIGNANNQNYGAEAILSSNQCLDELGIAHAGTGANKATARAPAIIERNGLKIGFIQRTSQYWPNNHDAGERSAGVAAMKAYTAYQPPYYKDNKIPPNRPGAPARVITWTDPDYLAELKADIAALKSQCDIVISSHHWGYAEDVLQYQRELAHAAIDAGADIIMGHGPHFPLPIEFYKGKPVYYGLGMFCFIRSNKRAHGGWTGMAAQLAFENRTLREAAFSIVRQNEAGEVLLSPVQSEAGAIARVEELCQPFGTSVRVDGARVVVHGA
jgi:poly-gamma-glutamate capsule biosynthesis protein CapA/YwtB (metallophosphatase superfamily)